MTADKDALRKRLRTYALNASFSVAKDLNDAADALEALEHLTDKEKAERQLAECQKECEEQARLNGMGSEREARLMAQVAELQRKHERLVERLREPSEKMLEAMRRVIYHSKDTLIKAIKAVSTVALRDSEGGE